MVSFPVVYFEIPTASISLGFCGVPTFLHPSMESTEKQLFTTSFQTFVNQSSCYSIPITYYTDKTLLNKQDINFIQDHI
jgi:hypothetical protein